MSLECFYFSEQGRRSKKRYPPPCCQRDKVQIFELANINGWLIFLKIIHLFRRLLSAHWVAYAIFHPSSSTRRYFPFSGAGHEKYYKKIVQPPAPRCHNFIVHYGNFNENNAEAKWFWWWCCAFSTSSLSSSLLVTSRACRDRSWSSIEQIFTALIAKMIFLALTF